jgi:Cu(I)/Ag(I) efflux system membrane fusion protein
MDLIPLIGQPGVETVSGQLSLSQRAQRMAEVETATVERKAVTMDLRLVGKVDYDETRMGSITARFPGRLDRLFVDYTGIAVKKGDHMVSIYSPDLVTAQAELLQAAEIVREFQDKSSRGIDPASIKPMLEAAREKLRLWGLNEEQVAEIEKKRDPSIHLTLYAPRGGIVVEKNAVEGMYVKEGTEIYKIADLSQVWVMLDAYESDLNWIHYGQDVEIRAEAYPGRVFLGRISFIDPMLNEQTRTVKLRVNVPNENGELKPGMFVRADIHVQVAGDGRAYHPDMMGKWLCPMHPEVIKDGPGSCDICGMPLVSAESLGYASEKKPGGEPLPLAIPASAPLITGKRAVVYVALPGQDGRYEGREVVLGPRAGDYYLVESGLEEGEQVVTRGNFKIDSEVQIQAGPSMMSGEKQPAAMDPAHSSMAGASRQKKETDKQRLGVPPAFRGQLDSVYSAYYKIHRALSQDALADVRSGAKALLEELKKPDMAQLKGDAHTTWMDDLKALSKAAEGLQEATDIHRAREFFSNLSELLIGVARRFGVSGAIPVKRFHCPMAFDFRGADWLQSGEEVENPYFGSTMFRCGSLEESFAPASEGE